MNSHEQSVTARLESIMQKLEGKIYTIKYLVLFTYISVFISVMSCTLNDASAPDKNYNIAKDENLSITVSPGTSDRPGQLHITNISDDTLFIHYNYVNSCDFILYSLKLKTDSGLVDLIYDSEKHTWIQGKIYAVCDHYQAPIIIPPKKSHDEEIRPTLFRGVFKLGVNYSKQMYPSVNDRRILELLFKIQD